MGRARSGLRPYRLPAFLSAMVRARFVLRGFANSSMSSTKHELMTGPAALEQFILDILAEKHTLRFTAYVLRLADHPTASNSGAAWRRLTAALLGAPSRGLDCRMLACHPNATGSMGRIDALSRVRLSDAGWKIRLTSPARLLHAKTYAFGAGHLWIGSHNLTAVAWTNNYEASIRSVDPQLETAQLRWFSKLYDGGIAP